MANLKTILKTVLLISCILFSLQGCIKVGPDYKRPVNNMPDEWQKAYTAGIHKGTANIQAWWTVFHDPVLNHLIEKARVGNYDLKIAMTRIEQARAQLSFSKGEYAPVVGASGSAARRRTSEGIQLSVPPPQSNPDTFLDLAGNASWEIDFWGKIARNVESSAANYQASIENYRDVLVILYADVASNYVTVRTLQQRIKLAKQNVRLQTKTRQLTSDRYKAGIAPLLDVRQAELNLLGFYSPPLAA